MPLNPAAAQPHLCLLAPPRWNELLADIRTAETLHLFLRRLTKPIRSTWPIQILFWAYWLTLLIECLQMILAPFGLYGHRYC